MELIKECEGIDEVKYAIEGADEWGCAFEVTTKLSGSRTADGEGVYIVKMFVEEIEQDDEAEEETEGD